MSRIRKIISFFNTKNELDILLKTLFYRIYSIIIAFSTFYIMTGKIKSASVFTVIIECVKVLQYYMFEKLWVFNLKLRKKIIKK